MLESHKLIFFTVAHVGDTTWRRLFRRMMGYSDWKNITMQFEGLTHLYDYNVTEATAMMTSPAYTRAIFVRDPKIRVLSSYLKNVITDEGAYIRDACCGFAQWCVDPILKSFSKFLDMIETCDKPFWRPQGQKMEPRYYKLLNFLGRYENAESDARRLLERIGAWDEYGSGWGTASDENIFYKTQKLESKTVQKYFKKPMKKRVHQLYQVDYSYPAFNFTMDLLRD